MNFFHRHFLTWLDIRLNFFSQLLLVFQCLFFS